MNNRKFSRKIFLGNVFVCPRPKGSRFAANALTFSQGGLSIFSPQYLQVGQAVEIILRADLVQGKTFHGRIVNSRVDTEGTILGIAFACPLSDEEKKSLQEKLNIRVSHE